MTPRRRRVLVATLLLAVAAALAAGVVVTLVAVADDLRASERLVDQAVTQLEDGNLGEATRLLGRAETLAFRANESLQSSVPVGLVRWMPGVSENVASLEESVEIAARMINGGIRLLGVAAPLEGPDGTLEVSLIEGTIPLESVAAAQRELTRLSDDILLSGRGGASRLLLPPVRDLRSSVRELAADRAEHVVVLSRGLDLLGELAGARGPRRFVIAVANTAEMRGAGGMILSYGVLESAGGTFELRDFGRIDELRLDRAVSEERAGVPEDLLVRWDGFEPTLRWRNATVGADFGSAAPLLLEMYEAATDEPVHGVIQIDPQGLAAILEGVGAITVPELGRIDASNVVDVVLYEAYARFPDLDDRSDVLGDVAEAAFERLVEGELPSIRGLAEALVGAVDAGHIRMHARSPRANGHLAHFGADGTLPAPDAEYLHVTVQNVSANKLDYFVDTSVEVRGARPVGERGTLRVEIEVANGAPPGATEPSYVFGPHLTGQVAGLYRGIVSLYLPAGTSLVGSTGGPVRGQVATFVEDGRPVVSYTVDLPAGQTSTVVLDLELAPRPPGTYQLSLEPVPRVRPTTLEVDIDTGDDPLRASVVLDRPWRLVAGVGTADP